MKSAALNVHLQVFMQEKGSVDKASSPAAPQRRKLFFGREHAQAPGWTLLNNDGQTVIIPYFWEGRLKHGTWDAGRS